MSFALPSLKDLMSRARSEFRAHLKGSDAWVWPNNVYVSAKVMAGLTFETFGFMSYIARMPFAHTAPDIESLLLHGEDYGIPLRPAAPATGSITLTSTGPLSVENGAIFARIDGIRYVSTATAELTTDGIVTIPAVAVADGKSANAEAGTPLQIISGVATSSNVTAAIGAEGMVLGVDVEDIESYRARILFRKRNAPHGGAPADYVMWGEQVSGVSRVFVEPRWAGPGTVRVFFMMDDVYADGLPTNGDVQRVKDHIDMWAPAGADLEVAGPVSHAIDITITGLTPYTTSVQEAVLAELKDMFLRRGRVAGIAEPHSAMPFLASPFVLSKSWISQAVANAVGEDRHVLVAPVSDVALGPGEYPTIGTITLSA